MQIFMDDLEESDANMNEQGFARIWQSCHTSTYATTSFSFDRDLRIGAYALDEIDIEEAPAMDAHVGKCQC